MWVVWTIMGIGLRGGCIDELSLVRSLGLLIIMGLIYILSVIESGYTRSLTLNNLSKKPFHFYSNQYVYVLPLMSSTHAYFAPHPSVLATSGARGIFGSYGGGGASPQTLPLVVLLFLSSICLIICPCTLALSALRAAFLFR